MQKTADRIFIELNTKDPCAESRQSNKAVGDRQRLGSTVIRPQPGRTVLQKWLYMVIGAYRLLHSALLIKPVLGKRVYHTVSRQIFFYQIFCMDVGLQILFLRLVRYVKITLLSYAEPFNLFRKGDKKRLQKFPVFLTASSSLPSEDFTFLSVDSADDLRRRLRAPLAEQMRDFKISDPTAPAHFHPLPEPVISKLISLVRHGHIHQLHGAPFPIHSRIQRRRKYRRKQHITPPFDRVTDKIFYDLPMPLTEYFHTVIFCQTIAVEPFRMPDL